MSADFHLSAQSCRSVSVVTTTHGTPRGVRSPGKWRQAVGNPQAWITKATRSSASLALTLLAQPAQHWVQAHHLRRRPLG